MLTYDLKAKVADFGLSLLYTNSSQNFGRHEGVIPYRWSAYEVIENRIAVIEKSDVWSFGVYVWELFSLCCDAPYTGMTYLEVKEFLQEDSQRLEKPSLCPQFLYDMMLHCWLRSYQLRPSFQELKKQLELFETDERTLENVHVHDYEEHDYDQPMYEAYSSTMVTNMMYGLEDCYEESPEAEVSYSYADETIQATSFAESYNLQHNLQQVDSEKIDQVSSQPQARLVSAGSEFRSSTSSKDTLMVDKRSGWVKFDDQMIETEKDQIQYADIIPHLKTSMNKEQASTEQENSITYAKVDYEKTEAFNQTRKKCEEKALGHNIKY